MLNTTELDRIGGIGESLGYSRSPNTSMQSSVSSAFMTPTTARGSNSSERQWKLGKLFCVALIIGVSFQNSYLGKRNQMARDITGVNMTVDDCGARRPLLGIVGQFGWRTGRDGKKSSVLVRTQDGRSGRLVTLVAKNVQLQSISKFPLLKPSDPAHANVPEN